MTENLQEKIEKFVAECKTFEVYSNDLSDLEIIITELSVLQQKAEELKNHLMKANEIGCCVNGRWIVDAYIDASENLILLTSKPEEFEGNCAGFIGTQIPSSDWVIQHSENLIQHSEYLFSSSPDEWEETLFLENREVERLLEIFE